jgi:hypothetical protein
VGARVQSLSGHINHPSSVTNESFSLGERQSIGIRYLYVVWGVALKITAVLTR